MSATLQDPSDYAERLAAMLANRPKGWPGLRLSVERKQNAHRDCDGQPWGWYEVFPLGLTVGYWGDGRDDLRGVDIADWNLRARAVGTTKATGERDGE